MEEQIKQHILTNCMNVEWKDKYEPLAATFTGYWFNTRVDSMVIGYNNIKTLQADLAKIHLDTKVIFTLHTYNGKTILYYTPATPDFRSPDQFL